MIESLESLLTDAKAATNPSLEKTAAANIENDETIDLLGMMSDRVEEDALTTRLVKHASAASDVFAARAAESINAQINTDELAIKVASLVIDAFEKMAVETSTEVIGDEVAANTPVEAVNPTEAVIKGSTKPTPPEVLNLHKMTEELLAKRDLQKGKTSGPAVDNQEPVKQASDLMAESQGYSSEQMEAIADYLVAAQNQ